jgi:hypothetical protein
MLGTSRLAAVGVFLVGVLLGASVCGAGRPIRRGADQGSGEIPGAAARVPYSSIPGPGISPPALGERHLEHHRIGR